MRHVLLFALCLASLGAGSAHAQHIGVSARAGTLGPGLELTAPLTQKLNVRLGGHYFTYSRSELITDLEIAVRADADLSLTSLGLMLDWFPARRGFRFTGGAFYNRNEATALVIPMEAYELEGKTFAPERIGTMTGRVRHKTQINPYAGIGFGNAVRGHRVSFAFDLGVLYTDSPKIEMEGTGMIAPTARQASQIEDALQGIKLYPVLSLGLNVRL